MEKERREQKMEQKRKVTMVDVLSYVFAVLIIVVPTLILAHWFVDLRTASIPKAIWAILVSLMIVVVGIAGLLCR